MNKVWDVTPAKGWMMEWVAKTNYDLIGLRIRWTQIPVTFVDSESPLGTQDGSSYSIVPKDNGDVSDEDGQHGRKIRWKK